MIEQMGPGNVMSFEPGEKYWHGNRPETAMTHTAVTESQDGTAAEWLEHVTDEQDQAR